RINQRQSFEIFYRVDPISNHRISSTNHICFRNFQRNTMQPTFSIILFLAFLIISVQGKQWYVGAASSTILPTINGKTDYVQPISEFDATSPGTLTPKFDVGKINVGNGGSDAKWVRDDLRATVVCIKTDPEKTLVILSADLYMLF